MLFLIKLIKKIITFVPKITNNYAYTQSDYRKYAGSDC
jgi:hypothetical protein